MATLVFPLSHCTLFTFFAAKNLMVDLSIFKVMFFFDLLFSLTVIFFLCLPAFFNAFLTAADKIVPLREQITGVTSELNDMASTMGDNVQGAIAGLSSAWEAFMLSFMNSTGPAKSFLDFLAKGIRNIAHELKDNNQ